MAGLSFREATDAVTYHHAYTVRFLSAEIKAGVFYCHPGRGDNEMAEPGHPPCLLVFHVVAGIESPDLTCYLTG